MNQTHLNQASNNQSHSTLRLVLTGLSMGVADLVPGVSGGSIALMLGIYDELIKSIKLVTSDVLKLLLKGQFKAAWQLVPFRFLLSVFGGIFIAILGFVRVVEFALEAYPIYIWSLFFGLIIGTAQVIAHRVNDWTPQRILLAVVAAITVFIVIGLPPANSQATIIGMFLTGAIAICAMILPGISGSLIMVILGQYENVISAASELKLQLLASFAAGAAIGLALFSRLLNWLLDNYHASTLAFLVGLTIGALRAVWPWGTGLSSGGGYDTYILNILITIICVIAGYVTVLKLEKIGIAREHDEDLD